MKFSINKSELQNALSVVLKGVASRSTLPVLSGILIDAHGDELTFQATDLELSIQYDVVALVEEEGRAVLPGKLFSDIVKNLPDMAVTVEATDDSAVISCDASTFQIKALSADDFPGFPHVDVSQKIEVPFGTFASMVRRVARVVSRDESRAIITGVLITLEGSTLRMVATDSYRLAVTQTELPEAAAEDFSAVISGTFLSDIASLPKTEDPITLALAQNQIVVTYQSTVFINRRIEGNFPNYKQLLPSSYTTRATVDTHALQAAVKRASLMGPSGGAVRISVDADGQVLTLSATTQDVGSAQETVPVSCDGESGEIAFNCGYMQEGLNSVETDQVYLDIQSSLKPGVLRAVGGEDYLYLIMPVRIS
ncbi:MAG: DNA polymerase III subunit beta [Coriobacteriia bacterium]|nr:DNA polymerase III subunit beta [Coriobacteriia bacterium]